MRLYTPLEKEARIKKEIKKLRQLFKDLPKEKQAAADGLIQEAAFMRVTLEECRFIIDQEGVVERFEQGRQFFQREHAATKVYNTMINRYAAVCRQLFDIIPAGEAAQKAEDELMAFVKRAKR